MTAPAKAAPMREDATETARIVRWIEQAIERAKGHGSTEGIWLFASQWKFVRDRLAHTARPDAVLLRDTLRRAQAHIAAMVAPDDRDGITRRILADCSTALSAARPDAGDEDVERVARVIELAVIRHGVEESDLEGTLDDARAALAAMREGVDRARSRAIEEAAAAVVNFRVGVLPGCGWLKDNGASRAALARLAAALKLPAGDVDPDAATGCADDQTFAQVGNDTLPATIERYTVERLSRELDVAPDKIRNAISDLRAKGLIQ